MNCKITISKFHRSSSQKKSPTDLQEKVVIEEEPEQLEEIKELDQSLVVETPERHNLKLEVEVKYI